MYSFEWRLTSCQEKEELTSRIGTVEINDVAHAGRTRTAAIDTLHDAMGELVDMTKRDGPNTAALAGKIDDGDGKGKVVGILGAGISEVVGSGLISHLKDVGSDGLAPVPDDGWVNGGLGTLVMRMLERRAGGHNRNVEDDSTLG